MYFIVAFCNFSVLMLFRYKRKKKQLTKENNKPVLLGNIKENYNKINNWYVNNNWKYVIIVIFTINQNNTKSRCK